MIAKDTKFDSPHETKQLRMKLGNKSKSQQPDQTAENDARPPIGLQYCEKIVKRASVGPLIKKMYKAQICGGFNMFWRSQSTPTMPC